MGYGSCGERYEKCITGNLPTHYFCYIFSADWLHFFKSIGNLKLITIFEEQVPFKFFLFYLLQILFLS